MNSKKLGSIIRLLRLAKGYSQENMADLLSISQSAYGKMERGRSPIRLELAEQTAKIFQIPLVELLKLDEKQIIQMNCTSTNGLNVNSTIHIYEDKKEIDRIKEEIENLKAILENLKNTTQPK